MDYMLSAKDSLFVRYVHDTADIVYPFLGAPAPQWPGVGNTGNHFVTIEERRLFSPTVVNLLRFSFTRTFESDVEQHPDLSPALEFFPVRGQDGGVNITGLSSMGPSIYAPLEEAQNKFPVADDVIWTHGAHSLRFGADVSRVQSNFMQQGWWGGLLQLFRPDRLPGGHSVPLHRAGTWNDGLLSRLPRNRCVRIYSG
jgi:hypothetical protein